jgi:hypothetical protein
VEDIPEGLNMFSTNLLAINCNKLPPLIAPSSARRLNPSRLIHDPSINSRGSSRSPFVDMRKLCREKLDCCRDQIMEMNSGIKSKCSFGRNQRRYRSPSRLSDGHSGAFRPPRVALVPILAAWAGCTTSDCKTFAPSEEGRAFSITNSSKVGMKANASIQASLVASILRWRICGESRLSRKA